MVNLLAAAVVYASLPPPSFDACLADVRSRGGDAWAARHIRLPSEDCCPYATSDDRYQWCDSQRPLHNTYFP